MASLAFYDQGLYLQHGDLDHWPIDLLGKTHQGPYTLKLKGVG